MNKLESVNNFIIGLDQQNSCVEVLSKLETFINSNEIHLNSDDFIELMATSNKLRELMKTLMDYKIKTNDKFIKKLLGAYRVINSQLNIEDKIILESLRVNFDESLRDVIFQKYKNRIKEMIRKKYRKSQDFHDYLQDGYELLLTCINTFDLESGYSFIRYVEYKVQCDILDRKVENEFEVLDSIIDDVDLENDLILKDFLERFHETINGFDISKKTRDIMELFYLSEEERNEHLERLNISKGAVSLVLKNFFRTLLRTTLLDEYSDFLDNPSNGKSMLEISRSTKDNPSSYLRTIPNLSFDEINIYKELQMLGISEEEIDAALSIMDEIELSKFYILCGSDLKNPVLNETPTPQEVMNFYSSKRTLIKLISKNSNKTNRSQIRTFNIYENMKRKGYAEEDISVGIQSLSIKDLKLLREMSDGNLRNSILVSSSNEQELKSIGVRLEKILKRNKRFKSKTGALIEQAKIQNMDIYSDVISVVRSRECKDFLGDIDEIILIIIFLNIGIIRSKKYSVSQIADITGVHMREIRRVLLNNMELVKLRLESKENTLKLR